MSKRVSPVRPTYQVSAAWCERSERHVCCKPKLCSLRFVVIGSGARERGTAPSKWRKPVHGGGTSDEKLKARHLARSTDSGGFPTRDNPRAMTCRQAGLRSKRSSRRAQTTVQPQYQQDLAEMDHPSSPDRLMLTKGKTTEIDGSRPRLERQGLSARYEVAITEAARDNLTGPEGDSLSPPRYNCLHRGGDSARRRVSRRRSTGPGLRWQARQDVARMRRPRDAALRTDSDRDSR
jgi:hypothetical protein